MSETLEERHNVNIEAGGKELTINHFEYNPTTITGPEVRRLVDYLTGRICTIIDASMSDKEQRDAVKNLIKHELRSVKENVYEWMANNQGNNKTSFPY